MNYPTQPHLNPKLMTAAPVSRGDNERLESLRDEQGPRWANLLSVALIIGLVLALGASVATGWPL